VKIEIRAPKVPSLADCDAVTIAKDHLFAFLKNLNLDEDSIEASSNKIKVPLFDWAVEQGWKKNRLADPGIPNGISTSIYKVNLTLDLPAESCLHHHRIYLHAFFDNRQAVGTNLLRMSIAKKYFERDTAQIAHLIALVLDSNAKADFGWDNSVGTLEEYEYAANKTYDFAVAPDIEFWAIRS
jgi:hypothetical protein